MTDLDPSELRTLAANTADLLNGEHAVVVLGTEHDGKALLAAAITQGLHNTGAQASPILTTAARLVGGGTDGKGSVASAGGRAPECLDEAIDIARRDAAHALSR
ncbi:DHHA1 domain-containing protein [Kitasatospora sp. MMS16-BH015]|uniref:DHHA1 domain-containing protein n=1 Tax=Kitasatospora sp. MMS16-BH015 TaxID=2018025 RepID=UPI00131A5E08|nr:DHHA1 domain-containing protein [Kitasatospora sp. MMS16-BH015]